ncbi:MAG: HAD family phosphatase [Gemmataceae bacterium]|nr:HAD family phosphatase [Gemmataceae bacterium]
MQTVIFDFGNVVGFFDHWRTLRWLERFTDMSAEDMYSTIYTGALEEALENGTLGEEEFLERFRQGCRLRCTAAELAGAMADIFWPNPEICGLIPKLKPRYRILLGSNTNIIHSRHFRRQFADVFAHIDALALSHEIGVRKPKVEFFQHCQKHAAGEPSECLFLDDIHENVASARTLGWKGIVYRPNDGLLEQLSAAGIQV